MGIRFPIGKKMPKKYLPIEIGLLQMRSIGIMFGIIGRGCQTNMQQEDTGIKNEA